MATNPSYLSLYQQGILAERVRVGQELLRECTVCPHLCRVNRFESRAGICRTNALPIVTAYHPHFGEEAILAGRYSAAADYPHVVQGVVKRCIGKSAISYWTTKGWPSKGS